MLEVIIGIASSTFLLGVGTFLGAKISYQATFEEGHQAGAKAQYDYERAQEEEMNEELSEPISSLKPIGFRVAPIEEQYEVQYEEEDEHEQE